MHLADPSSLSRPSLHPQQDQFQALSTPCPRAGSPCIGVTNPSTHPAEPSLSRWQRALTRSPGSKSSLPTPSSSIELGLAPSSAHVCTWPCSSSTSRKTHACGLLQRTCRIVPSKVVQVEISYITCEWCAWTGGAPATAQRATGIKHRNLNLDTPDITGSSLVSRSLHPSLAARETRPTPAKVKNYAYNTGVCQRQRDYVSARRRSGFAGSRRVA